MHVVQVISWAYMLQERTKNCCSGFSCSSIQLFCGLFHPVLFACSVFLLPSSFVGWSAQPYVQKSLQPIRTDCSWVWCAATLSILSVLLVDILQLQSRCKQKGSRETDNLHCTWRSESNFFPFYLCWSHIDSRGWVYMELGSLFVVHS
jgi:hypothetical protein